MARTIAHRASITIIEGCNKNCTFCVVPMTRGRERNRRLAEIVAECARLVGEGVVEIELLGQTVNAYSDPSTGERLPALLRAISAIDGLRRLRFVTSHPRNFDDDLIAAMAESDVVCPALHLPFQSGSDRILGRMKRQYTRGEYLDLVGRLRTAIPGLAMSTDIILGFPGETDEDFAATISVLDEVLFSSVFCFTYSPRPRTAATRWGQDVPVRVAQERLARLNDHQQALQLKMNEALVGQVLEVLVEGSDKTGQRVSGRSPFNHLVHIDGVPGTPAGTFVMAVVEKGLANSLLARPLRVSRAVHANGTGLAS
ncbi:MiaB/RimO family radical SAM methylthiotransferase [bacterium]|nr:MiaB/RimO family radical SAM methylthiotransferase [bacterium]